MSDPARLVDAASDLVDLFLARLGLDREPPSVEALQRIMHAQLATIPYETTWIHLGEAWTTEPGAALERIARHRRGGYCFHLNGALAEVLDALGYSVSRHVGGVHGPDGPADEAMTNHLVLTVGGLPSDDNPEGRWYVDAGLGDGPTSALPLGDGTHDSDHFRYELYRTEGVGDWGFRHDPKGSFVGMVFRNPAVTHEAFAARNVVLSTSPDSGFVKTVTAQRRDEHGATIIRGCALTRIGDERGEPTMVDQRADWFDLIAEEFGLTYDGVEDAAKDRLWNQVITTHQRWLGEQAAT